MSEYPYVPKKRDARFTDNALLDDEYMSFNVRFSWGAYGPRHPQLAKIEALNDRNTCYYHTDEHGQTRLVNG